MEAVGGGTGAGTGGILPPSEEALEVRGGGTGSVELQREPQEGQLRPIKKARKT